MADDDILQDGDAPAVASTEAGVNSVSVDLRTVRSSLDSLVTDLRALWSSALERGDDYDLDRLLIASHSVQRAVMALKQNTLLAATSMDDHHSDHGEAPHEVPAPR